MLIDVIIIALIAVFVLSIVVTLFMVSYLMFEETELGQDILERIREKMEDEHE